MKFSFIVPVFNAEKYLRQCLDSIVLQTFNDYEVILVDDGSTDGSSAICDEYAMKDSRFKVFHKENEGVSEARKTAIMNASGDYLCCVDSDDWIEKDYLEAFSKELNDNPDLVCCGFFISSKKGDYAVPFNSRSGRYSRKQIETELFPSLIQKSDATYLNPVVWGKAVKKELCSKYMTCVPSAITIGEDRCCTIPMFYNASSLKVINRNLYHYRYNASSAIKGSKLIPWNQTELSAGYISSVIDMSEYDFKTQMDRYIVHGLFTSCTTVFRNLSYKEAKSQTKAILKNDYYSKAITKACFKGSAKASMMIYAFRNQSFLLMKLYALFQIAKDKRLGI